MLYPWGKRIFLLLLILGCQGCVSTSSKSPSASNSPRVSGTKSSPNAGNYSSDATFVASSISNKQLEAADSAFDTISLSEFRLNEHKLFLATFKNDMLFKTNQSKTNLINSKDIKSFSSHYRNGDLGKYLYVVGHTDSVGNDAYNQSLSARRAWTIADLLVKNGVNEDKIKIVPAGEIMPRSGNGTLEGRAKNRRVEILSANSSALAISYFRQIDCSKIDVACKKALLPVLTVKKKQGQLYFDNQKADSIASQSPELNNLAVLESGLRKSISETDRRMAQLNDEKRLSLDQINKRNTLIMPVDIRKVLTFEQQVRKALILGSKYMIKIKGE